MPPPLRIGLYLDPWHTYVRDVLGGVRRAAARRKRELFAPWPGSEGWPDPEASGLAGLILGGTTRDPDTESAGNLPYVIVGTASQLDGHFDVTWDYHQIGQLAAEHLLEHGHRTLAVWHEHDFLYQQQRIYGFVETAKKAGIDAQILEVSGCDHATRTRKIAQLPEPCAVFCPSDRQGHDLLRLAEQIGRRVPERLAVVGAGNDEDYCELTAPPLSSVALPGEQAGHVSVERLASRLSGDTSVMPTIKVAPTYVAVRHSSDVLAVDDLEVARALRLIRDNATRGLTAIKVHESSAIGRRTLEIRFQKVLGRSIRDEIVRVRHKKAKELLALTRMSIADVAENCGFSTPQRFTAAFTQSQGMSPSAFRTQATTINTR